MKMTALEQQMLFASLAQDAGIIFPAGMQMLPEGVSHNFNMALDAEPTLVTTSNAGIPAYLANYIDPKVIEVLVAPMKAAVIAGETKKGDWTTVSAVFDTVEYTGEVAAYGDYSEAGASDANYTFPSRESFHYQTLTQWGELQLERAALAKIDHASRVNLASILTLNKYQNLTYFLGVANLKNYGLLNDPALPASGTPGAKTAGGLTWGAGTAAEIYTDIVTLFGLLQAQANGTIDQDTKMVLAMSPTIAVNLTKTNQYNVNVTDQIKKNFPNMRIETAPEYNTGSGQLVQLIAEDVDGQDTVTVGFTEKLRAHPIIRGTSSFKQKKTQGTWGAIWYRPFLCASLLGV